MTSFARIMAGIISTTGDVKPTVVGDIGLSVYSTLDSLPTSALTSGDQAFVSENNRIYVSNGTGWYNVALLNATPTLSISPSGAVTLATDGSTPTVITLIGTDSDTAVAGLTYTVESDGSFANIATLSQDSSVFTITPLAEGSATPGSSTLTFKVSDGISFGSGTTEFSLTFAPDWTDSSTYTYSQLSASDGAVQDYFGYSTEISGDGFYIISGARYEDDGGSNAGAAYIHTRSGSTWTQQARLDASDVQAADFFGESVAISDDGMYAIVGSVNEDGGSGDPISNAGAAYIFVRSGSTWTQQAKLTDANATSDNEFGSSVAMNSTGDYAVVGAFSASGTGSVTGEVFVYTRSGSTWSLQAEIEASDFGGFDQFGYSVSINPDATYLAVGARWNDDTASGSGSAYIFTRSGSTWTQQAKLNASDPGVNDYFGSSVSINSDGTYAIVGAPFEDGGAGDPISDAGAAYIFTRSGSTWTQQQKLTASDAASGDDFGWDVTINGGGNTIIVGAPEDDDGAAQTGAAYVYSRSGSTWTQVIKLNPANTPTGNDWFGYSVSLNTSGNFAAISAYGDTPDGGSTWAGTVSVYEVP